MEKLTEIGGYPPRGKPFKKEDIKKHYQILQLEKDKTWITADFGDLKMCKENKIITRQI